VWVEAKIYPIGRKKNPLRGLNKKKEAVRFKTAPYKCAMPIILLKT